MLEESLSAICPPATPCPLYVLALRATGTYHVDGGVVTLTPAPGSSPELATTFTAEQSCESTTRLRATESGVEEVFAWEEHGVGCAAVLCATGSTCVMHDVQCIRAPCPRVPECVPVGQ